MITINIFCFKFLFILNNTNRPVPAFANKPPINEPKLMIFDRYNSVILTDEAQFGIRPISAATIGP